MSGALTVCRAHMTLKKENSVNSWHKEGLSCECFFFCRVGGGWKQGAQNTSESFSPWERSDRVHYFLVSSVCLVKRSVMVINMRLLWRYTSTENTVSLCYFESIGFYSAHNLPSASGEHNKEKCWSKKKCLGTNLCVIIQIKKTELSVRCVSPAYSPRRVKHKLILHGSDTAVCTVLGEKDQIKRFLAF